MDDRFFERLDPAAGGPPRPDGRAHLADAGRGHDRHDGRRLHQREEPLQDHHRRDRGAGQRRQRHRHRAGRALRRLVAVREGRRAGLRLQLPRPAAAPRSRRRRSSPAGKAELRFQFDYDGGGPAKGGQGTLFVNGEKVAEGRIPVTQAGIFSADETADVGIDLGTPVVEAIGAEAKSRFTGRIPKVTVEVK